jgi:CheY-like chemotaxis protein
LWWFGVHQSGVNTSNVLHALGSLTYQTIHGNFALSPPHQRKSLLARKILLADDSVTAQNMGRRILADAGYDVITVNNGSAAIKKATEQKPDLIVLDVYMPGYSGLEVCQRLRETPGTSRIPVLLTVGKLEPFKPEEAQRVRADAFVIKPFEASELLAALAKLEDKIVPEGAPPKPGKSFRMDNSGGIVVRDEEFGDTDTGWKNRLSIPPVKKGDGADSDKDKAAEQGSSSAVTKEKSGAHAAKDSTAPTKVPADITQEELAAIAAAAAVVSQKNADTGAVASSAETPTEPAASKEIAPEAAAKTADPPAPPVSQEKAREIPPMPAEGSSEDKKSSGGQTPPEPAEAEVAEVLAKLAPAGETGKEAKPEEIPVLAGALAAAAPVIVGPHWTAQEIPVPELESASSLMYEMEKMHAAMAAVEGRNGSTYLPPLPQPGSDSKSEPAVVEMASRTKAEETAGAPQVVESISSQPRATASPEPEAIQSEKNTTVPEPVADEKTKEPELSVSQPSAVQEEKTKAVSVVAQSTAYAAAASAGSDSAPAKGAAPVDEDERQRATQLAEAWQNWQNVRESILGSPMAAQITEAAAAATLKESQKAQPAAPATESASDATNAPPPGNPTAIANIVDSVLAELKPKLMEEIARSLGKDKK